VSKVLLTTINIICGKRFEGKGNITEISEEKVDTDFASDQSFEGKSKRKTA